MLAKNLPTGEKWWKLPVRLLLDQATAFKELVGGDKQYFMAIQKAHLAFIKWLFLRREAKNYAVKPMQQIPGVYSGSVIWKYFVKRKKSFSEIVNH